ncbi:MAG: hypothetical protein H6569_12700 [Lewinellaceae bacterium]|nr:hypothetical protein [Lewinellaceae bacterium]
MPLSKPLPELRRDLQELLTEDLAAALSALRELLPENTDKHGLVLALLGRLKDANKERIRNTITNDDYQRRVDTIRAECFDLVAALEAMDFEVPESGAASAKASAAKAARQGSILYRVPHRMPLQKPTICTIRVAIDEDAILEDIVLDDDVRLRPRVEVSDMMRAELLDPDGEVFNIRPLSETEQLVREQGYTQWLFSVKPKVEGEHQLLVKVSMMEYNAQLGRYVPREVSVLETVTIVTEAVPADLEPAPLKSSGEQVTIGPQAPEQPPPSGVVPPASPGGDWKFDKVVDPKPQGAVPPASVPYPTRGVEVTKPQKKSSGGARALAVMLIFILAGGGATWAFTPAPTRAWWVASFQDTAEAYASYVEKFGDDPRARTRVEKALFLKSEKTGRLADLREYQRAYPEGAYRGQVLDQVNRLDNEALASIRRQPDAEKINRYVQDFPESERLPELREAAGNRQELMPVLEKAYLQSIREQPTEQKVRAYLRDFPESERLPEVTEAVKSRPEVLEKVQPELEDAYLKRLEVAPTEREAEKFLESFPAPQKREKFEQILEQKPQIRRRVIDKMERSRDVGSSGH